MIRDYKAKGFVDDTAVDVTLYLEKAGLLPGPPKYGTVLPVCAPVGEVKIVRTEDHRHLKFQYLDDKDGNVEILDELLPPKPRRTSDLL
jgi:hypothetical protein